MPQYDFRAPRLFVRAPLAAGLTVSLDRSQAHYLGNVLRLTPGDRVLVFNGRDGEWLAALQQTKKHGGGLLIEGTTRPQPAPADLHYLFAPLKAARLDYMVQKAVEMGVSVLQPVLTQHGQVARISADRMLANAIEAAEQCGLLSLPEICSAITRAMSLAESVTSDLIASSTEMVEPARRPSLVGTAEAACLETVILVERLRLPALNSWKST